MNLRINDKLDLSDFEGITSVRKRLESDPNSVSDDSSETRDFSISEPDVLQHITYTTDMRGDVFTSNVAGIDGDILSILTDSECPMVLEPVGKSVSNTFSDDLMNPEVDLDSSADPRLLDRLREQIDSLKTAVDCCRKNEARARSVVSKSEWLKLANSISVLVIKPAVIVPVAVLWEEAAALILISNAIIKSLVSVHFDGMDENKISDASGLYGQVYSARLQAERLISEIKILLKNNPQNSDEKRMLDLCMKSEKVCRKINKLDANML